MSRALHLLIMLCVLMCGLHLGEPAQAHDGPAQPEYAQNAATDSDKDDRVPGESTKLGQGGHSHCPMTPEQTGAPAFAQLPLADAMLFAAPVTVLHSLSQAPPVDPPLA